MKAPPYCPEHNFTPPEHSGMAFCPQCEFPEHVSSPMNFCSTHLTPAGAELLFNMFKDECLGQRAKDVDDITSEGFCWDALAVGWCLAKGVAFGDIPNVYPYLPRADEPKALKEYLAKYHK